jgi:adenosyl cobinamide kinase/adenosyl cobinamide phosphate guanylyltransferase
LPLTLVLGPRRSGKSAVAERLARESVAPVTYLAPLTITDEEMRARVAAHQARRPAGWRTVETADPLAVLRAMPETDTVLLDSLGTWVSETLWRAGTLDDAPATDPRPTLTAIADAVTAFAAHAAARPGATIVVSEEAGWSPVPPDLGTRRWLDALGDAAQACSSHADRILLVVAGRALELS